MPVAVHELVHVKASVSVQRPFRRGVALPTTGVSTARFVAIGEFGLIFGSLPAISSREIDIYTTSALKGLRKAPTKVAADLRAKLKAVAADPVGQHSWAHRLTDQPGYRVRQGDGRAVYRLDHKTDEVIVDIIAKRDEVYR